MMNATTAAATTPSSLRIPIEEMTCASCLGGVERALSRLPGVEAAQVNLATEAADIRGTADDLGRLP